MVGLGATILWCTNQKIKEKTTFGLLQHHTHGKPKTETVSLSADP